MVFQFLQSRQKDESSNAKKRSHTLESELKSLREEVSYKDERARQLQVQHVSQTENRYFYGNIAQNAANLKSGILRTGSIKGWEYFDGKQCLFKFACIFFLFLGG